jgi:hypothetical protein
MLLTVETLWQTVRRRASVFERTPKYGGVTDEAPGGDRRYHLPVDPIVVAQACLGAWALATAGFAAWAGVWPLVPFPSFALGGALFVIACSLRESLLLPQLEARVTPPSSSVAARI